MFMWDHVLEYSKFNLTGNLIGGKMLLKDERKKMCVCGAVVVVGNWEKSNCKNIASKVRKSLTAASDA